MDRITNPQSGEISRVTQVDIELSKKKQELLESIHANISPLSMQTKREVLLAVRLLMQ